MRRRTAPALGVAAALPSSLPENRPLILVSGATRTVAQLAGDPHLGRLVQPRNGNSIAQLARCGMWWAADNDCFQGLDPAAYTAMLSTIARHPRDRLLFVTAPDVVADAAATAALFDAWLPQLRAHQLPVALVAQDGLTPDAVPWHQLAALFIGGSTAWKLGEEAAALIAAARARSVWVHVGRLNTEPRLRHFDALQIDSFDGTQFSRWPATYLPAWLARLRYRQLPLP
jgi:hypothetical protein